MFGTNTYLIWLACFIGVPLVALALWRGKLIWRKRCGLAWATLGSLVGGWIWDASSVYFGVWYYNPEHLAGWWWAGLPLEEWLWIVGVTWMFGALTVTLVGEEAAGEAQP